MAGIDLVRQRLYDKYRKPPYNLSDEEALMRADSESQTPKSLLGKYAKQTGRPSFEGVEGEDLAELNKRFIPSPSRRNPLAEAIVKKRKGGSWLRELLYGSEAYLKETPSERRKRVALEKED